MKGLAQFNHLVLPFILFLTCDGNYQIPGGVNSKEKCNELNPGQKGFLHLIKNDEPGEPLMIYGRVVDQKTNQPLSTVSIFLYQTDATGIYSSSGRDEDARIKGTIHTNENGCFKIKTILPGDYPGQKNSRHLHYIINAQAIQKKEHSFLQRIYHRKYYR